MPRILEHFYRCYLNWLGVRDSNPHRGNYNFKKPYNVYMRNSDKDHATSIIGKMIDNTADRSDIIALLILVREHIPNQDSKLRDIAHCVAHTERDRGFVFDYFGPVVNQLVDSVKGGGIVPVYSVLPIKDFLVELYDTLLALNITRFNLQDLLDQRDFIEGLLVEVLDGVVFTIAHPNVLKCAFVSPSSDLRTTFPLSFSVSLKGLSSGYTYKIPYGAKIYFPVF
jgi:hypothetical protein